MYSGKYTPEVAEMAHKLALLGLTDLEMADVFGVVEQTWYNWQKKHPALTKAIQRGRVPADAKVAESNYKRATGYVYEEEVAYVIDGKIVKTTLKKHMPPHPTAFIFWLKNRTGRKNSLQEFSWRDVVQSEVSGKDGGPIKTMNMDVSQLDLSDLTDEELRTLETLGVKLKKTQEPAD